MTSRWAPSPLCNLEATRGTSPPLSNHEQTEPGVLRAAGRAGVPGPLQGTRRLQGRTHRGDQGEPGPVAARRRGPPRPFRHLLSLGGQVLTGHSRHPRRPSIRWGLGPQAGRTTTASCVQETLSFSRGCSVLDNAWTQVKRLVPGRGWRKITFLLFLTHLFPNPKLAAWMVVSSRFPDKLRPPDELTQCRRP